MGPVSPVGPVALVALVGGEKGAVRRRSFSLGG